ncbi:MAG TPA: multiheme c-type cytochrome [Candidatus Brocadiales bacterium]|nr:multiheme c-type cytochrome [Candidatus Brocadiales bacterium]
MYRGWIVAGSVIIIGSLTFFQTNWAGAEEAQKYLYVGNAGCKCHLSKGCFEGDEYKERLHSHTFEERLKTPEDKNNPECLKCHATAYKKKIKDNKPYLEDVQCEACHGAGEKYEEVKKNYKGKGKDAFNELLKKDPMLARKEQFDAGLYTAGISGPYAKYKTVKEQCLECHWEDAKATNKCPKAKPDSAFDLKKAFEKDDHRNHDEIDDVIAKMSGADKGKWKDYLEKDPLLLSPLGAAAKKAKK